MATVVLERVKPTEPAILEMVRNHYSHRDNIRQRPRTEKTSKTWWSNARLVVFSDPERTLVFAWQWPKDGIRKDGQNGYNNTLFHRSDRCPHQASDIVLAAEQAVVNHWGSNRAYTYVDPVKIKSVNPGFCYKIAGWKQIKISKTGKPLLEKILGNGNHRKDDNKVNLRNVLRAYSLLRQLSDDESALLETLRQTNDNERALLVEAMSDKPQKKSSKKSAGGGGGGKSKHASSLGQQIQKRQRRTTADGSDDDNRFDGAGAQAARAEFLGERCAVLRGDLGGTTCDLLPDHNVHHLESVRGYHPFVSTAQSAATQSTTDNSETAKAAAGDAHHVVSSGD